jgi:hypothetical protein
MQNAENNIVSAVESLNHILPLTARHRALNVPLQRLHTAILHSYIDLGRSLTRNEMALHVDDIDAAVKILQRDDLVVFNDDGEPIGAYPFTMEEREHIVSVNGHTVHCMCALDALAVASMFDLPTRITSRCHVTNEPVTIRQTGRNTPKQSNTSPLYFGINWSAASDNSCCANSLCTEMIFLKNKTVAKNWLGEAPEQRQIFALNDATDFAARFFGPLIHE